MIVRTQRQDRKNGVGAAGAPERTRARYAGTAAHTVAGVSTLAGNRATSRLMERRVGEGHTAQRKQVGAIVTTPTRPRVRPEGESTLLHGTSGAKLEADAKVTIHDNKRFSSRLKTDEPTGDDYTDEPKDTIWYKMVNQVDGLDAYIRTGTFRLDPTAASLESMMKVYTRQGLSLKARMVRFIEDYGATTKEIDPLLPYIEQATQPQRDEVWQDGALMDRARSVLAQDVYLALFPALRAYENPDTVLKEATGKWTSHFRGPEADKEIQAYMQKIGMEVVTQGRRVTGEVSVVSGKVWDEAFMRQWGPFGYTDTSVCNAFVDVNLPKRHIWINKNWGNAGTVLHEGMHKYADPTLRDDLISTYKLAGVSRIDEGLTELFTRQITEPLGIARGNYASDFDVMEAVEKKMGSKILQDAYYAGKYSTLTGQFKTVFGHDWATFSAAMEAKRYGDAKKLL